VSVILARAKIHKKMTHASITENVKNDTAEQNIQKHKVSVILARAKIHKKMTHASITENVKNDTAEQNIPKIHTHPQ
jgi:hypothetical protein